MPEYLRSKAVNTIDSWVGKKESDGSFRSIIDEYNKANPLPRNVKMQYSWPWCAATVSAVAVLLGYTPIMPIEISCYYLIEAAKKMGIWVENDAYVPSMGDYVLYNWADSGIGDNTGTPDHVGMVTYVNKSAGYFVVTEGNYSDSVKKRTVSINGRYIRGFITPKYTDGTDVPTNTNQQQAGKSVDTIAREVISGLWGNGADRKANLEKQGYDYAEVQRKVNEILNGSAPSPSPANTIIPMDKKVTATCSAKKFDKAYAGTYRTTANLYMRNDAGTNKKALVLMPKDIKVQCYGYYNVDPATGVNWLYIQVSLDGVQYTGFSCISYLSPV